MTWVMVGVGAAKLVGGIAGKASGKKQGEEDAAADEATRLGNYQMDLDNKQKQRETMDSQYSSQVMQSFEPQGATQYYWTQMGGQIPNLRQGGVYYEQGGKQNPGYQGIGPIDTRGYADRIKNLRGGKFRKNKDGSKSTVLMGQRDSFAYPTLFQDDQGEWFELEHNEAYDEAKKRGELFETNSEAEAISLAEGSWKNEKIKMPGKNWTPPKGSKRRRGGPLSRKMQEGGHISNSSDLYPHGSYSKGKEPKNEPNAGHVADSIYHANEAPYLGIQRKVELDEEFSGTYGMSPGYFKEEVHDKKDSKWYKDIQEYHGKEKKKAASKPKVSMQMGGIRPGETGPVSDSLAQLLTQGQTQEELRQETKERDNLIISRKGDPYEYARDNDTGEITTRKKGNKKWVPAKKGTKAYESISDAFDLDTEQLMAEADKGFYEQNPRATGEVEFDALTQLSLGSLGAGMIGKGAPAIFSSPTRTAGQRAVNVGAEAINPLYTKGPAKLKKIPNYKKTHPDMTIDDAMANTRLIEPDKAKDWKRGGPYDLDKMKFKSPEDMTPGQFKTHVKNLKGDAYFEAFSQRTGKSMAELKSMSKKGISMDKVQKIMDKYGSGEKLTASESLIAKQYFDDVSTISHAYGRDGYGPDIAGQNPSRFSVELEGKKNLHNTAMASFQDEPMAAFNVLERAVKEGKIQNKELSAEITDALAEARLLKKETDPDLQPLINQELSQILYNMPKEAVRVIEDMMKGYNNQGAGIHAARFLVDQPNRMNQMGGYTPEYKEGGYTPYPYQDQPRTMINPTLMMKNYYHGGMSDNMGMQAAHPFGPVGVPGYQHGGNLLQMVQAGNPEAYWPKTRATNANNPGNVYTHRDNMDHRYPSSSQNYQIGGQMLSSIGQGLGYLKDKISQGPSAQMAQRDAERLQDREQRGIPKWQSESVQDRAMAAQIENMTKQRYAIEGQMNSEFAPGPPQYKDGGRTLLQMVQGGDPQVYWPKTYATNANLPGNVYTHRPNDKPYAQAGAILPGTPIEGRPGYFNDQQGRTFDYYAQPPEQFNITGAPNQGVMGIGDQIAAQNPGADLGTPGYYGPKHERANRRYESEAISQAPPMQRAPMPPSQMAPPVQRDPQMRPQQPSTGPTPAPVPPAQRQGPTGKQKRALRKAEKNRGVPWTLGSGQRGKNQTGGSGGRNRPKGFEDGGNMYETLQGIGYEDYSNFQQGGVSVPGGQVQPISDNSVEIQGNNSSEVDGVDIGNAMVDDGEMIKDLPNEPGKRVFSDTLKLPGSNKTIAQEAKRLEKQKHPDKPEQNERIEMKLDELFKMQQVMNGDSHGEGPAEAAAGGMDPAAAQNAGKPVAQGGLRGLKGPTAYDSQEPIDAQGTAWHKAQDSKRESDAIGALARADSNVTDIQTDAIIKGNEIEEQLMNEVANSADLDARLAENPQIRDDYDKIWDYKMEGDKVYTKRKTSDKWVNVSSTKAGKAIYLDVFNNRGANQPTAYEMAQAPMVEKITDLPQLSAPTEPLSGSIPSPDDSKPTRRGANYETLVAAGYSPDELFDMKPKERKKLERKIFGRTLRPGDYIQVSNPGTITIDDIESIGITFDDYMNMRLKDRKELELANFGKKLTNRERMALSRDSKIKSKPVEGESEMVTTPGLQNGGYTDMNAQAAELIQVPYPEGRKQEPPFVNAYLGAVVDPQTPSLGKSMQEMYQNSPNMKPQAQAGGLLGSGAGNLIGSGVESFGQQAASGYTTAYGKGTNNRSMESMGRISGFNSAAQPMGDLMSSGIKGIQGMNADNQAQDPSAGLSAPTKGVSPAYGGFGAEGPPQTYQQGGYAGGGHYAGGGYGGGFDYRNIGQPEMSFGLPMSMLAIGRRFPTPGNVDLNYLQRQAGGSWGKFSHEKSQRRESNDVGRKKRKHNDNTPQVALRKRTEMLAVPSRGSMHDARGNARGRKGYQMGGWLMPSVSLYKKSLTLSIIGC